MRKKVVLAYSGGLDTSFCIPYLTEEKGMEVHTVLVNTGGFSEIESKQLEVKAKSMGAVSHKTLDIQSVYYEKCLRYLIFGNVLKNNTYPLSVSSERAFQAISVARYAKEMQADAVAHGCTGAGNDQVRFDYILRIFAPDIDIIAPIREGKFSREEEAAYLQSKGFPVSFKTSQYSINQGIWGTSVGGAETLRATDELPEEAFPTQRTKEGTETITLGFEKGEPVSVNGTTMHPIDVIKNVYRIAGPYGIGRDIHVGDTLVGLKGRVGFEAAAPLLIIKAHHLLEKHVLGKWQMYWKDQLSHWYGMMLHEAQYPDPVMRHIECFLEDTQQRVTGTVSIRLRPYTFSVTGCSSPYDLMDSRFGDYGEGTEAFTAEHVEGFVRMLSLPVHMYMSKETEHHEP
jgi:argininosuccinate synthase